MSRPLEGLKILDFSRLLPGPYATLMLADLGAEVLRVGSPRLADPIEMLAPFVDGDSQSAASAWINRGKRSIGLNLKDPRAIEIVHQLLESHDVLVEGFRPGVMARFGLDYATLSARHPRLIYGSLTGYGQSGPLADRACHDINFLALSGLMSYSGHEDAGPSLNGMQVADLAGASNLSLAVLAAVYQRARTGSGQHIDIAMLDGAIALNAMAGAACLAGAGSPSREDNLLNGGSLYDFYETADGRHLSFGGIEPQFFAAFCEAIGRPDLIPGWVTPSNVERTKGEVSAIIKGKTLAEWRSVFASIDACTEPVLTVAEALDSAHVAKRGLVVEVETESGATLRQIGSPFCFSTAKGLAGSQAGAHIGSHNAAVLGELGFSLEEIEELRASGVTDGV